jgi:hypothetical protein
MNAYSEQIQKYLDFQREAFEPFRTLFFIWTNGVQ